MVIAKKDFELIRQIGKEGVFYLNLSLYPKPIKVQRQKNLAILKNSFRIDLREKVKSNFLYLIDEQGVRKIALFSSQTNL